MMTGDGLPVISVVTPSYNQAQFLEAALRSVLDQDYPALEYLVVDGGSNDGSPEIIRRYAARLDWWVSEPDGGQSEAINKGLRRARGEILAWLNSDDCYLPGALQRVAEYFTLHPEVDCLYGDLQVMDPSGQLLFTRKCIPYDYSVALYSGCMVPQPAFFFRRRVLERVGYLDESLHYSMDVDFFIRIGRARLVIHALPVALAGFRLQPGSKTITTQRLRQEKQTLLGRYLYPGKTMNAWRRGWLAALDRLYRLKMYLWRLALRGDWRLFQAASSRKRIAGAKP